MLSFGMTETPKTISVPHPFGWAAGPIWESVMLGNCDVGLGAKRE